MTPQQIKAMKLALEALEKYCTPYLDGTHPADESITAIKEALAQPEQDSTYTYASSLATAIWQKHYMKESPKWKPLDTTEGVLTQIDNMTCGLIKEKPAQPEQEPVQARTVHITWNADGIRTVNGVPDYTHPPQRTWVGLTNDELTDLFYNTNLGQASAVAQAIALLKEKNT